MNQDSFSNLLSLGYSLELAPKVLMALIAIGLYLTLDQQVEFSFARITGVANLLPKDVV